MKSPLMRLSVLVACGCVLISGVAEADIDSSRPSAGCGKGPPAAIGESVEATLSVGELEREYRLRLPADYDPGNPAPLVLAIHGYTDTAEGFEERIPSIGRHADTHGFVVAFPQATGFEVNGRLITSWNDLACNASPGPDGSTCIKGASDYPTPPECGEPRECDWCTCHDDVGFIIALLDEIEATVCVDLNRVFAIGESNGAMLVHRLGCDHSDRFAAIAPVVGTLAKGFNCAPGESPRISLMNVYGTNDTAVRFDGTPSEDGFIYTPAAEVMAAWAGAGSQQCSPDESEYPTSRDGSQGFRCVHRASCATGAEVVNCAFDGGHNLLRTAEDQFVVEVIWGFFEKNGR